MANKRTLIPMISQAQAQQRALQRAQQRMSLMTIKPRRAPKSSAPKSRGLDRAALDYLRLIRDPCYAPLVHPVYPGADGGTLARFENEFTLGADAAQGATIMAFVPGSCAVYVPSTALANDTATSVLSNSGLFTPPGLSFLQTNASAVRCVSACIQVAWPGSELARQGQIALGQITGATVTQATTTAVSVSTIRPLCHMRVRMPDSMAEVCWRPSVGDCEWHDPSGSLITGDVNKKGALVAAVGGLPLTSAIGVRFRIIAVYEYVPKVNLGIASAYDQTNKSNNTIDQVFNVADQQGPKWAFRVGQAINTGVAIGDAYAKARSAGR